MTMNGKYNIDKNIKNLYVVGEFIKNISMGGEIIHTYGLVIIAFL